jgi:hypothetical protein
MGLKGDFDEIAKVWSAAPWRVKVYLVLSAGLASSSVASLSEAIFKWKGFFLDALLFYRAWITTPMASAWSTLFQSTFPQSFFDYAVFHLLIAGATLRYIFFVNRSVRSRVFETLYIVGMVLISLRNIAMFATEQRDIIPMVLYLFFLVGGSCSYRFLLGCNKCGVVAMMWPNNAFQPTPVGAAEF